MTFLKLFESTVNLNKVALFGFKHALKKHKAKVLIRKECCHFTQEKPWMKKPVSRIARLSSAS